MTEPADRTPRGRLRALLDWFAGDDTPVRPTTPAALPRAAATPPSRIGHYAITGKLGQGGMGVVYAARDERLDRVVAVKTIAALAGDETARKRFWREARVAAGINHPNVCRLYEVGEHEGEPYIVMELLEGQALSARLAGGALNVSEALPVALGILAALGALHERGVVHRDLKPSNVFLTPHGVKLLDFGLARADAELEQDTGALTALTRSGMVLGTPRYMAPEQVTGDEVGIRADLFAAGAILFEMLAGRPAFGGANVVEILHATLHEQPPALTGSPAVVAACRVIRRALAKKPADRPASAGEMAEALRAIAGLDGEQTPALARTLTRMVVLPFRVLRPDAETDFLAFSLPDAIATSLSGIGSLVVRSSAAAARHAGDSPDLAAIAADLDVDRVVLGTLLRAGDQVRTTAQLVEAPRGTLLTSHTVQASLGDLFQLQDDIVHRVVEALALPLGGAPSPAPDVPRDARAYELYLRANELARSYDQLPAARELYEQCLELDPSFAPAWARLARCHRVIGKYIEQGTDGAARAERAVQRALELNPRLTFAHKVYANLEADTGQSRQAVVRLLREVARHGNDPELFAGLVHACRYCGLFEESMAAHREARRLDPQVPTSLEQTVLMTGDLDRLLGVERSAIGSGDNVIRVVGLGLAGRQDEARVLLRTLRDSSKIQAFRTWADYILAWLDRRVEDMASAHPSLSGYDIMADPEAIFQDAWLLCDAGAYERGLEAMGRAVDLGYTVVPTLRGSRQFDALRGDPRFQQILARAEEGRRLALSAFREAGGGRLLGLT